MPHAQEKKGRAPEGTAGVDHRQVIRDALMDSDIFGALEDDEIDRLVAYGQTVHYPAGKTIFQKGDPGDSLMIVVEGRVKISTVSAEGKEAVLNFVEPCQSFGEIAILDGKPRSADATTVAPTELFVLRRGEVMAFIEKHPEIALRIMGMLCAKLRRATELLEDHLTVDMETRLARTLVRFAREYGQKCPEGIRIELGLSQRELGGIVGLARENVNRQLSEWRSRGILRIDHGRITICRPDELEAIAEGGG